jgi:hypothetical protein
LKQEKEGEGVILVSSSAKKRKMRRVIYKTASGRGKHLFEKKTKRRLQFFLAS